MRLHEAIALRKGEIGRNKSFLTECHKMNGKPTLFGGFTKTYSPLNADDPEKLPGESTIVQQRVPDQLSTVQKSIASLFDTVATVEYGNTEARADIVVNNETLLKSVPVTYLLFLESQFTDIRTYLENLPSLSPDEPWSKDENSGLFRTPETKTHRNKKVQKPVVKYPATPEHPAQTEMVTVDELAGYWNQTKFSGAVPATHKAMLIARIEALLDAVKTARARANSEEVTEVKVGTTLMAWLFA
ncbi:MAG: hypothetical protein MN733_14700 [Nitrososphaera sp.]|nr:hypothetical protein [Nitrososphaera sp.]